MVEGLEVTIKYRGAKHHLVASPPTVSSEFAILKRDLAHLRVHSPSQRNVRRVDGSFILRWPTAGTSTKVTGQADSLHQRWFKLCGDDPEALKLRDFLSIESITLVQDDVQICSTAGPLAEQASQDAPPRTLAQRAGEPLPEMAQQPATTSVPANTPLIPPPRAPPTAPRLDRQPPPHLKRRMSGAEDLSSQKLDVQEATSTTSLESMDTQSEQSEQPTSPNAPPWPVWPIPGDAIHASPQPMEVDVEYDTPLPRVPTPTTPVLPEAQMIPAPPSREPGEMTPQPARGAGPPGPASRAPQPPALPYPPAASPYASSASGNGDYAPRRHDRDVNRLMRELWDTRRHLTAVQAREQVLLDELERLGVRPEGAGRDEILRLEADLKSEKERRVRAERALNDVERECRAPFVVPALFQAFLSISELSN